MTNRVNLQILADYCQAAAEAMAYTLIRTAHSTFVKETEDFSCGLLTPEGLTFASPKSFGATWFTGLDYGPAIAMIESYEDGDICVTNDVYSGFVATHTPDMHIWKPVFVEGELMCFAAGHIHNTDMGGAVPASLSRTLTEIHQEGVRIPPVKLVEKGVFNENVARILDLNVRAPAQNRGDLQAQIASVMVGERKIKEVIARFGKEAFKRGIRDLMDYSEAQARRILRSVPDGEYFHAEFIDEDSEGGPPCRIALTARIADGSIELDYTGSDPQLNSSINLPTGGQERHALIMVGLGYVLYTLDPTVNLNAGTFRCARAILPSGTIVNPEAPAAVGMRSLICSVAQLAMIGVFAKAIPERMPASPAGAQAIINVRTLNAQGRTVMASVGPVPGGAGGNPSADGAEGSGANSAFLKNTPIEISEADIPVRFRRYGLVPDSGGPGRWRGGTATVMEFEVLAPQTLVTARNRDRSVMEPWGLNGGRAGSTTRFLVNPGTAQERDLGNRDIVSLEPGDILSVCGNGGGGWGDPLDRPAELVHADVRKGLVSIASSKRDYGVVIRDDAVDRAATEALRRDKSADAPVFDYGRNRGAFERRWSPEHYRVLTEVLAETKVSWRHWVKKALFAKIGDTDGSDAILAAYEQLRERYPNMATTHV